jgi:hypothetical protein
MPNRIGSTILSAVYAATLAAAVLAGGPAAGDDTCLAAPNAAPPEGSHWYYRIDRARQRHCWYLGPDGQPVAHHAAAKSAASSSPPAEAPLPALRPAAARESIVRADIEGSDERTREEASTMVRSPEPDEVGVASEYDAGSANLRQMSRARIRAAAFVPARALDAWAVFFLIVIAGAAATAGIACRAVLGAKPAPYRPPPRVTGVRAGRIASLASEKAPRALVAPRPSAAPRADNRKRAPALPTGLPNIEEEFREMVRALDSQAA